MSVALISINVAGSTLVCAARGANEGQLAKLRAAIICEATKAGLRLVKKEAVEAAARFEEGRNGGR